MPDQPEAAPAGSPPSENDIPVVNLGGGAPPPDEILQEAGKATEGTFTQKAGMSLATWVGALGAVVTLAIVARWIWMTWCITCPPASTPADQAKVLIDNYKALQEQALQSAKEMFDTVVVKALLPIFTSILGYIFGARSASEGRPQGDEKGN